MLNNNNSQKYTVLGERELDRLNPLLEQGGLLVLDERGYTVLGERDLDTVLGERDLDNAAGF